MTEKKEYNHTENAQRAVAQDNNADHRWEEDRRRIPSQGFTYISSVGWIDRRERLRRKDDSYNS